jgi:hypothetical protein
MTPTNEILSITSEITLNEIIRLSQAPGDIGQNDLAFYMAEHAGEIIAMCIKALYTFPPSAQPTDSKPDSNVIAASPAKADIPDSGVIQDADREAFEEWYQREYPNRDDRQCKFRMSSPRELMTAAYQAALLHARKSASKQSVELTQAMIEAGAEFLYGHPKHKAIEWAKLDKFESDEHKAQQVFLTMLGASK